MERSQLRSRVRRSAARSRNLALIAVLTTALLGASSVLTSPAGRAETTEPVLPLGPVVVLSDRPVCTLLGNPQTSAGIVGTDGGLTLQSGDTVYWAFGDTVLDNGWMIPNAIATSTDTNASDCIDLTPKHSNGRAVPLLGLPGPNKLTVWPMGMAETAPGTVHFYYASVAPDATLGWRSAGMGLASFDSATLSGTAAKGGSIIWPVAVPGPSRAVVDGAYVYALLDTSRSLWTSDTILARVPKHSFASPDAYEYWNAGGPDDIGHWVPGLWDAASGSWDAAINDLPPLWRQFGMHNGVDIAYNEFLGKWLAVYTTNFMTSFNARVADALTGPWSANQSVLVDCLDFHGDPTQEGPFVCYTGMQHEYYQQDGGRTIYVTYSNSESYQVYLHEIRLAAAIEQWTDKDGGTTYLPHGNLKPDGTSPDGVAFYASDMPLPGFAPIHRWEQPKTGAGEYGPVAPAADYKDAGVAFYAPLTAEAVLGSHVSYGPVYRWHDKGRVRYSPLNLGPAGYTRGAVAFYAPCPDTDDDGLTDCEEPILGTDAHKLDTDADALEDGYEHTTPGCDPTVYNDDLDGIAGNQEALSGTNPCVWDTGAYGCAHGALHPPTCDVDTDGDGCMDAFEQGSDPRSGGRRSATNRWDFYDVNGDEVVNLLDDMLTVIRAFGPSTMPNYSLEKDRSAPPGAAVELDPSRREPWDLGPPDGGITIVGDVLGVARQFGHSCHP